MANQEKQSTIRQGPAETHSWGHVLANGFWVVTLLMILAFFWQSIGEMLSK